MTIDFGAKTSRKTYVKRVPKNYIIVVEASPSELENAVIAWMEDDCYSPLGGVCTYVKTFPSGGERTRFAQAMIRKAE